LQFKNLEVTIVSRMLKILSLALCLSLILPGLALAEPMGTVYRLPKDNVDFALDPNLDYLVVGQHQPISEEFRIAVEKRLVTIPNDVDGDFTGVENATYSAYTLMRRDLLVNYGIEIGLYDGYRTLSDHQWLIDIGAISPDSIPAGYSEHHTGLLLNIVVKIGEYYYNEAAVLLDDTLPEEVRTSTAFATLRTVAVDYGFITRFPEGKEALTGSPYNPNEFRFVGSPKVAHAIMDNGLCLEEYLETLAP